MSDPGSSDVHVDGVDWKGGKKKPKKKDATMADATKFDITTQVCKVDDSLGLVMGFAIVCKQDGEDYFDVQGDHIPEDAMLGAAVDFMQNSRVAKEMHAGDSKGSVLFAFPLTTEIAKSFGIETQTTGLMIAMKPNDADMLAKFKSGELTGFSIGGRRITDEDAA
jgi:hypothetical protein